MKLVYKKTFLKSFEKLSAKDRQKVVEALKVFKNNPFSPELKNHALNGDLKDFRAISVRADIRITFQELDNYYVVYLVKVGTHNQVYF